MSEPQKDDHEPQAQEPSTPPIQEPDGAGLDLESLRLGQNFEETVGVKKALITVPTGKPNRQSFVRVRPGEEWRLSTYTVELQEDREVYLVQKDLWLAAGQDMTPVTLFTAIDKQGTLFIWPVKLAAGRENAWHRSAMEAATMAMDGWVSVRANMHLGAYEVFEARGELGEPDWPEVAFQEILRIAFQGRLIDTPDHEVLRKLRGEV